MVFHWSLSDSKSPQISKTLLSILADVNNAVVYPPISKFSFPFINPVPRAQISIGINTTFMLHSFSIPDKDRGIYPSFQFLSILLFGDNKVHNFASFLSFFCWLL